MSEWSPLAVGRGYIRRDWSAFAGPYGSDGFPHLVILQQDSNGSSLNYQLDAIPSTTARVHIYDEPTWFGQSRPNLLGVSPTMRITYPPFPGSGRTADMVGTIRLMLFRDSQRTQGVWAEVEVKRLPVFWDQQPSLTISAGSEWSSNTTDYSQPMPSAMLWKENLSPARKCIARTRLLRFGVIGSPALAEYSLNQFSGYMEYPHYIENITERTVPVCIAVVQGRDDPAATVIVGDLSDVSWHYIFDAGMSFIPAGDCVPLTYAAIETTAYPGESAISESRFDVQTFVNQPPVVACNKIWRSSVGRDATDFHNGHYSAQSPIFARTGNGSPDVKACNAATVSEPSIVAFGPSGYQSQRTQFSKGVTSVPAIPSAGHWTVLSESGPCDGDMTIAIGVSPVSGFPVNAEFWTNYIHNHAIAGAVGYELPLTRSDAQGVPLVHNCAHASQTQINRDSETFRYGRKFGLPNSGGGESFVSEYYDPSSSPVTGALTCDAQATYENWLAAVEAGNTFFQLVNGSQSGASISYETAYEEYSTLRDMQAFCRLHHGKGSANPYAQGQVVNQFSKIIFPSGEPDAFVSTSGNADAWQKGVPAAIKVSDGRLFLSAFIRCVGLRRWRRVTVWTHKYTVASARSLVRSGWLEIPRPDLDGLALSVWQKLLSTVHQFTAAESAQLRQTGSAKVPVGATVETDSWRVLQHHTVLERMYGGIVPVEIDITIA